ncbi:MAG: hypothetical protein IJ421_04540 [Prevotella sp.]|nr:hypothetical protein [Prevotella sp.]
MAKQFFSSVIVLAMLMALLPAGVAQAAAVVSTSFETADELFESITYDDANALSVKSLDDTVAYNGNASMKFVQGCQYAIPATFRNFEYGKTYRVSARVKIDNPSNVAKKVNFETFGDVSLLTSTKLSWGKSLADDCLRVRSSVDTITDSEWHFLSKELTLTNLDDGATTNPGFEIGIETQDSKDTIWVDDFSIVEAMSADEDLKGNGIVFKSFDSPSLGVTGTNLVADASEVYEGAGSAKVTATNVHGDAVMNFGTYNFEVGQAYKITSYIKTTYPEDEVGEKYIKYEFRNQLADNNGVVTVASVVKAESGTRPGFEQLTYSADEQYADLGWSRLAGAPVSDLDNEWLRHESYFIIKSTDATITNADYQVNLWTNVPVGTEINVDSVKIEKTPAGTYGGWDNGGLIAGMGTHGATIYLSGAHTEGTGLATAYRCVTGASGDHKPSFSVEVEENKKYRVSSMVYVPLDQNPGAPTTSKMLVNTAKFGKTEIPLVFDQWVEMSLEFDTTGKELTDRRIIINPIAGWTNSKTFHFSGLVVEEITDDVVVETDKANISNLAIQDNGTVTYTADEGDYIIAYEYLDGTTVLDSGMIFAGEFLPNFDLNSAAKPIVKLTAKDVYGGSEATVTAEAAGSGLPEDPEVVEVDSVDIYSAASEEVAESVADCADGMLIGVNYTNTTDATFDAWVIVAFYNEDGLMSAKKYNAPLEYSEEPNTYVLMDGEDYVVVPFETGATKVKAFAWTTGAEALCTNDEV